VTAEVTRILFYTGSFPVDVRHNAKIERETLAALGGGADLVKALVTAAAGSSARRSFARCSRVATRCAFSRVATIPR